jgi:two-component system OmpR family response regulator
MDTRCLLIEDDDNLASQTAQGLERLGHAVKRVSSLDAATEALQAERPDIVVLDRMLPDGDSTTMIKGWRDAGLTAPVILTTVRAGLHERITGLDSGADDFLSKPFDVLELDARMRALMRMQARHDGPSTDTLTVGSIEIDFRRREVRRHGHLIAVQPREFKLLGELAASPGEVVPRGQLLERVWNLHFDPRTKLIETHISRLRDKLNAVGDKDAIETVRGIGYRIPIDA